MIFFTYDLMIFFIYDLEVAINSVPRYLADDSYLLKLQGLIYSEKVEFQYLVVDLTCRGLGGQPQALKKFGFF